MRSLTFGEIDAFHVEAESDVLAGTTGRPVVVMAHGLGGTKDSGLEPFARGLAKAGLDVLAFDYRGFGASGGARRQHVSVEGQREDYRAAIACAAGLPGVDPARVVLWGVSLAGGHAIDVAAGRDDIAAVVSLTPLVDGTAAGRLALKHHTPAQLARSTAAAVRSKVSVAAGRAPVMMPLAGPPGSLAAMALPGHLEDYLSVAGPTWRNEVDAAVGLELGSIKLKAAAKELRCPLLVQIADFDRSAPPHASAKVAFAGRGEVRHYPCDHFDVWPGKQWFDHALTHQVSFLTRHLTP